MANDIGKLRRSTVVSTFGPGAVVDFRAEGAAISGVVAGIEEWDRSFKPSGLANPQQVHEPRLERKLGVKGFRLPPIIDESSQHSGDKPDLRRLVAVRFPDWLQCPACDRIAPSLKWGEEPGKAFRYCVECTKKAPGGQRRFAVPVRFVMACRRGHLDDFPWQWWVGHRPECKNRLGFLTLKAERPGLAGLIVRCPECKERKSLDGIFNEATWRGRIGCHGRRQWLPVPGEECKETVRAMQRGASNLYFPAIESALSIPDWSDNLQEVLGIYFHELVETLPEDRADLIAIRARGVLKPALEELALTPQELAAEIERRVRAIQEPDILDLRAGEYRQFTLSGGYSRASDKEFETRTASVPASLARYFSRIVRVVRLREVRAIHGFTRIEPPGDVASGGISPIWVTKPDWLPGIDVRGEGIFLEFSAERLAEWETPDIEARAARVDAAWQKEWTARHGKGSVPPRKISARFLLVHTYAHALMRQLTLDCGYSSAALRERLYVRDGEGQMAGVLVYTATSDADGTLGGLQRQGEPDRIARIIPASIRAMEWCSSDPLCIEGVMGGADGLSLAACHACVLAPETACEEFNRFLDRALLVGAPGLPKAGYFAPMLDGGH
ncbi:DrmB family protein [Sorangium sp. So ce128]|uniref:DrmB family protein n=1 Tax=Sorangium sp. So ce128 TaxID=3133281 RepID=UPI003F637951